MSEKQEALESARADYCAALAFISENPSDALGVWERMQDTMQKYGFRPDEIVAGKDRQDSAKIMEGVEAHLKGKLKNYGADVAKD